MYNTCDMCLYLIPATQINMISNQIAFLELSILYGLLGKKKMEGLMQQFYSSQTKEKTKTGLAALKSLIAKGFTRQEKDPSVYRGTAIWHKCLFVLTKGETVHLNYFQKHSS